MTGPRPWTPSTRSTPIWSCSTSCFPGLDGVEICRLIRSESDVPIIMLTARTDTHGRRAGLEAGADDYVTKPFKSKELLARVSTRLRRTTPGRPSTCVPGTSTSMSPVTRSSAVSRSSP